MASWKRKFVDAAERLLDVRIIRKWEVSDLLELDCLERFFREFRVDCVFDVGANAGQYAGRVRRLGFEGPIISFEPNPHLAEDLRKKAAPDSRWFIEQTALDDSIRPLTFNVMASSTMSSMHLPDHSETALFSKGNRVVETVELQTSLLETHFERYSEKIGFSRPFLKMDTQGADVAVARGAGRRLAEFVGLQSELSFKRLYKHQSTYREAIDFYESQGFALTALVPNNAGHFPDLIELDCIMYNTRKAAR